MTTDDQHDFNPIRESFKDVSTWKLIVSTWKVIQRIYRLQGQKAALRVLPIVWTIIWSVKGFSKFHAQEFERARRAHANA